MLFVYVPCSMAICPLASAVLADDALESAEKDIAGQNRRPPFHAVHERVGHGNENPRRSAEERPDRNGGLPEEGRRLDLSD